MAEELIFRDEAAALYDQAFAHVTAYFVPFLLRAADVAPGMRVLDIATGTGLSAEAALGAVGPTGHVTAVDISPGMVARARDRLGDAPNVSLSVEDGQALPFPDASFDAVLCNLGLMFFPDPLRGLTEFCRVPRPAGRVLYRQAEIFAREGVNLETSTLSGWVGATAAALAPLVDALAAEVIASDTLHVDDTPVPVLAPGTGKTKTGRLWTYVRDERPFAGDRPAAALFFYSPDRKGEHPRAHLKDFRGVIHADGYAGFNELFAGGKIVEAACWAHVRRKFFDVHAAIASPIAKEALDRIGQLYRVEETIKGLPSDHRRRERRLRSKPIAEALASWSDETARKLSRKSELAAAFRYMRARWAALTRCFDDGRLALDNNPVERAVRCVAIGRKNYLFAGSDAGGRRAAAMYSLIESAKLNGINPQLYLADVLARIADHPARQIADLLPWNWKPAVADRAAA